MKDSKLYVPIVTLSTEEKIFFLAIRQTFQNINLLQWTYIRNVNKAKPLFKFFN